MNWAGLLVAVGVVAVAFSAPPYTLILLPALYWVWRKS